MNETTTLDPLVKTTPSPLSGTAGGVTGERIQPSRFESKPCDFVGIAGSTLVYVGVGKREDFDKIALPCSDTGESHQGHVLTKTLGGFRSSEVTIVFQHWLKQKTLEATLSDMEAQRK
jgi:hypothetical protein